MNKQRITVIAVALLSLTTWAQAKADTFTAMVVGDSISAAYGLREADGWVALAEKALNEEGLDVKMVNASISGDTTAGGLRRLPDALERFDPDLLIIELGGNDGLRGYSTDDMQSNLEQMAAMGRDRGAQVLILGMLIPTNYGQAYLEKFGQAFVDAAEATQSELIPFLLEPIAQDRNYFQSDGIHPTAEAQPLLLEHVLPTMEKLIKADTSL